MTAEMTLKMILKDDSEILLLRADGKIGVSERAKEKNAKITETEAEAFISDACPDGKNG